MDDVESKFKTEVAAMNKKIREADNKDGVKEERKQMKKVDTQI